MSIAIVTDSTADIPPELLEENHITVIPAILVIDGQSFEDGAGITRREFYERLPTMETPPTTATPSIGTFQQNYDNLIRSGHQSVISIHVSSQLSGIFSAAQTAAQEFQDRVVVVDSEQLSLGLGYQVLAAADAAASGLSIEAILHKVEDTRQRVRLISMLDTLEYVHRSGRVSWARARIGSLLKIKPFLEVRDSQVLNLGQVRTRRKGILQLIDLYRQFGEFEKLALLHTNAESDALHLLAKLGPSIPENPLIVNVTTIVGTHVGPNALGFCGILK